MPRKKGLGKLTETYSDAELQFLKFAGLHKGKSGRAIINLFRQQGGKIGNEKGKRLIRESEGKVINEKKRTRKPSTKRFEPAPKKYFHKYNYVIEFATKDPDGNRSLDPTYMTIASSTPLTRKQIREEAVSMFNEFYTDHYSPKKMLRSTIKFLHDYLREDAELA